MCGISGFISLSGDTNIDHELMKTMNRTQAHRGPDAEGYYFDEGIALAHRRLSIIDVSSGQQPMFSDDKGIVIVFNGEIYNFLEVNALLKQKGHVFATHSDTETIIRAYQEWGIDCLEHFNGMFAFVLYDKVNQEVFMARDRIGEKPFYYSHIGNNNFIFASELKALKKHPGFNRNINPKAVEDFMTFGYVPEPKAFYEESYKLSSGHYMFIKLGETTELTPKQYWDLPTESIKTTSSNSPEIIDKLRAATDIRMMSEVPLGAFLSGGVDSSAIVAMMSGLQDSPVNTIAIGFDVPEVNESEFAQLVATRYKTAHTLEVVNHENFDVIDKLANMYDEPFADSSALPTFKVCEAASKKVTVCLSGDGGDELFVGYRRYRLHNNESKVRNKLPSWLRKFIFKPLARLYPKADWAPRFMRAKTTFQSLSMENWEAYLNSISKVRVDQRADIYSNKFTSTLKGYSSHSVFADFISTKEFADPIKEAQYLDFKTWMPGDILTKVDRASMANSIEVRVPMLEHQFVEWAFSIDSSDNLKGKNGKAAFKKALEPYLPEENLYREKMGFSIPLSDWLKGPLRERVLESLTRPSLLSLDFFQPNKIMKLYHEHINNKADHSDALWSLMMLSDVIENDAIEFAKIDKAG